MISGYLDTRTLPIVLVMVNMLLLYLAASMHFGVGGVDHEISRAHGPQKILAESLPVRQNHSHELTMHNINPSLNNNLLTHHQTITISKTLRKKVFENIVGYRRKLAFSPFLTKFSTMPSGFLSSKSSTAALRLALELPPPPINSVSL